MRIKLLVTCLILLFITGITWIVLNQEIKDSDDGVSSPVVTVNKKSELSIGNHTSLPEFIPITSPVNMDIENVIVSYSQEKSEWKGLKHTAIRSRKIELSPFFFDNMPEVKGDKLALQLFDDVLIEADISDSYTNVNGTISTTAGISGSHFGRVFITKTDNELRAKITVPETGRLYAIHYNPEDGIHYSLELDPKTEQIDDVGEHPVAPLALDDEFIRDSKSMSVPPMLSDESVASTVVDVMFVYSNDALNDSDSVANINNLIALAVQFGNDAHTNTNTGIILNLIHSEQVNYNGTNDSSSDLTRLTNSSDGYIDNVHTLRTTYGADFVCLIVGDYTSDGGVAWLIESTNGSASYTFSVVTQPAMDSYTPVHEIGHNMGLSHAKDQNTQPGPTSWSPDAHGFGTTTAGWHWHPTPGSDGYCSVMAYTNGAYFDDGLSHIRVGLFSDPAITYMGLASGDSVGGDSARVLRTMKSVYEGYRSQPLANNTIILGLPNGGENWTSQTTRNIKWNSMGVSGNVKIDLYKGGSLYSTIAASTLNDRVYAWSIPTGVSGTDFRIRVSSVINGTILDESNADFTIDTPFYNEPLDSNPGYTTTGQWEYGEPQSGNTTYGGPGSAYTGVNIYDTNLESTYFTTSYLTSTAIDCSDYRDVRLKCMAQISVTSSSTASIQVSNNGSTWTTLYSGTNLWQTGWSGYDYDISSIADGQSTVYIRWAIDHSGGSVRSGYSVDDIKLTGISETPSISISDAEITEGDSGPVSADFTVSLDYASANTITVDYETAGNTATSDFDFSADSGTVTFVPGDTSETIAILVQGDTIYENDETFYVNLSSPINAILADSQGTGTITNDDALPSVSLSVDSSSISETGGSAVVTATLSNETTQTVTVNLGYSGTATGSDYTASVSNIVIASGLTGTATIEATSDTIFEGTESIIIDIISVTNGSENETQQQTVTITDDDSVPTVSIGVNNSSITEAGGVSTITATLSHETVQEVTVNLGYAGTAGGSDFILSASSIVISSGTTGTITMTASEDAITEGNEIVIVDITSVNNGLENGMQQEIVTITDNDSAPSVTLSVNNSMISETGGFAVITATLSNPTTSAVTVSLEYTGTAGYSDYLPSATSIEIIGSTTGTARITAVSDTIYEGNESVILDITGVTNAIENGVQQKTVIITDDDNTPTVSLSVNNNSVSEAGGSTTVTAVLSNETTQMVTVNLGYSGTANSSDYMVSASSIVISGGTTGTATITATQDNVNENTENVIVDITGVINGIENGIQRKVVSILDYNTADSDGDGMPDVWELANGLDPDNDDSTADEDGDGYSNFQEYLCGTSPQDHKSFPVEPKADAGPDQVVSQNSGVTLNGLNSIDPDGVVETYLWEQITGSLVSLSDNIVSNPAFTAPNNGNESLTFSLTVTDNDGFMHTDTCIVNVTDGLSEPPTASAGPDQTVDQGTGVTLNGSNSIDSDGVIEAFHWYQISGSAVGLSDNTATTPVFTAPANVSEALIFSLTVTDHDGLLDSDTCIVNVINGQNKAPTADAGIDQVVEEGLAVVLDGTGSRDQEEGSPVTWLWTQIAGLPVTLTDPSASSPGFISPLLDSGDSVLRFQLTVADSAGLKNSDQCLVNVTGEMNEKPIADAGPDQIVEVGSTVYLDGTGSIDPEDGSPSGWLWAQTEGLPVSLSDPSASTPNFIVPPVNTGGEVLNFQLIVTDSSGLKSMDAVSIVVSTPDPPEQGLGTGGGGGGGCFISTLTGR